MRRVIEEWDRWEVPFLAAIAAAIGRCGRGIEHGSATREVLKVLDEEARTRPGAGRNSGGQEVIEEDDREG